jgi:hypothetical protein
VQSRTDRCPMIEQRVVQIKEDGLNAHLTTVAV